MYEGIRTNVKCLSLELTFFGISVNESFNFQIQYIIYLMLSKSGIQVRVAL